MKKWRNEDGFTMVEMVIVIAIAAILMGTTVATFGYISSSNARKSAARFNSSLNTAQTNTMMQKEATYLYLFKDKGIKVVLSTNDAESLASLKTNANVTDVGGARVDVIAEKSGGSQKLEDSEFIQIAFDKATGAYRYAKFNGYADTDFISEINFSVKENYKVTLVQLTGKHVMSK
ncbi:MAG: type II secretion system GspH family protein [Lachnospiraceae bacterium]|nr:type II secretion system GspH family protein [Lachnospiraceae bacterium]